MTKFSLFIYILAVSSCSVLFCQSVEKRIAIELSLKNRVDSLINKVKEEENDLIGALDVFDEALELAKTNKYLEGEFKLYFYAAKIYRKIGHFAKAFENYSLAKAIVQDLNYVDWEAKIINNESIVYYYMGNLDKCTEILKQAIPIYQKVENKVDEGFLYANLAFIYFEKGVYDSSIYYNQVAENIYKEIKIKNEMSVGLKLNFVKIYNRNGKYRNSIKYANSVADDPLIQKDYNYLADLNSWWARSLASLNRFSEAKKKLKAAKEYLLSSDDPYMFVSYYEAKSEVFSGEGNNHRTLDYLQKALNLKDSLKISEHNILLDQFKRRLEIEEDIATQKSIEFLEQKTTSNYLTIIFSLFFGTIIVAYVFFSIKKKSEFLESEKNIELEIINKKFESFLEQTNEAVRLSEADGKLILWNKASEELTGIKKTEAIGENYVNMINKIIPEEYLESYLKWTNYVLKSIKDNNTFKDRSNVLTIKNKDNESLYIQNRVFPIFTDDGVLIAGTTRDVTQHIKYEQGLIDAKISAEQSDRNKTEFLAQMSHEIRTPINTILNFCSLLEMEFEEQIENELKEIFGSINRSGERIIKMMDMLLNISEIESGMVELKKNSFDLYEKIIEPLTKDMSKQAEQKNLELQINKVTEKNIVYGDEYTVTQAISNLLDTSIKFTEKGKINITVDQDEMNNVVLTVVDTGKRYSDEILKRLFDPFSKNKNLSERDFSVKNLGLKLVKQYCDLNDIDLIVESDQLSGSKFKLLFNSKA